MRSFADLQQEPTAAEVRGFRLVVFLGGLALALFWSLVRHRNGLAAALAGGGAALSLLSMVPGLGRWIFAGWMGLGLIIGRITSPILLGVVWVMLFVPVNVIFRLVRRDAMKRKFPADDASFWVPHDPRRPRRNVGRYFQQF